MSLVLLLVGTLALLLVNDNRSEALDVELAATLNSADDVGDPPPGSYLARRDAADRIELTSGAPAPVAELLTAAVTDTPTARVESDDVELGAVGYRLRMLTRPDGQRWAVAADLAALRSDQRRVLQAIALAEAAGVAGAVAAAALLSRRSVQPLARALELQHRFVADASHELRAPLTVLHTRAQMLAADPAADTDTPLGRGLRGLVTDTRALGEVVEDLLAAAEFDEQPRPMQQVDLGDVAAAAVESMIGHAHSHGVQLTHDRGERGPHLVNGRPAALRRAVTALVDNAVGHTPDQGRVRVSVDRVHDEVRLVVADDGIGLDPARAEELFTRSYHGDHGERPRFGLGLALVHDTAVDHGGRISADGEPGIGARFTLALPAATSNDPPDGVESPEVIT